MGDRVRVWDILLIAALLAVSLSVWFFPKREGAVVMVSVDGEVKTVLPLEQDASFELEDGTVIVVEEGAVRVEHSTCPDHLCERMGAIHGEGETILCLPNRISVTVSGSEVDGVVG